MVNRLDYDRSKVTDADAIVIPVGDVYNAFFKNQIIDTGRFAKSNAGATEKRVLEIYSQNEEAAISSVLSELQNENGTAYKDLSDRMQAYLDYVVDTLLTENSKILVKDRIDTNDEMYLAWKNEETISVNRYLSYAISKNWIDTSRLTDYLEGDASYSSASEIYQAIIQYVGDILSDDGAFEKIIYEYMIKEGKITGSQVCRILFEQNILKYNEKISPIARCWIYPGSHGSLNVVSAIQHSCNDFFYEVGYRLGTSGNEYNDAYGIERLQKYAEEFGLGDTTGLEITESEPKISDSDVVRSSIGQGTNNYTTAGLSRYISAVANGGVVYNLSLFEKTTDVNGKLVKDYEPEIRNQVEGVADSTWTAVHNGMRRMVTSTSTFNGLGNFELYGKTGTAQQSKTHPNHGLFVGFTGGQGEKDIAFAIRIANGYNSTYPSEIGRDIVRYYYGLDEKDEIVTGHAREKTARQ